MCWEIGFGKKNEGKISFGGCECIRNSAPSGPEWGKRGIKATEVKG